MSHRLPFFLQGRRRRPIQQRQLFRGALTAVQMARAPLERTGLSPSVGGVLEAARDNVQRSTGGPQSEIWYLQSVLLVHRHSVVAIRVKATLSQPTKTCDVSVCIYFGSARPISTDCWMTDSSAIFQTGLYPVTCFPVMTPSSVIKYHHVLVCLPHLYTGDLGVQSLIWLVHRVSKRGVPLIDSPLTIYWTPFSLCLLSTYSSGFCSMW